ncbi:sigma-70 family RNA polymerase sigma factor [Nocardioides sp. HB32]
MNRSYSDPEIRVRNTEIVGRLAAAPAAERRALADELVLNNLTIARSIARRYARRSNFGSDVEQVAYLALVLAARGYDPTRGTDFLAYAVPSITGAVKHYFRDSAWMIRPPRPVQTAHVRDEGQREQHTVSGISVETCFRPRSLDAPATGDLIPVGALIRDDDDRTWECADARLLLLPHLRELSPRARQILRLRFVEDRTQDEIAATLGISQFHVSRLLNRCLGDLRDRLKGVA